MDGARVVNVRARRCMFSGSRQTRLASMGASVAASVVSATAMVIKVFAVMPCRAA